MVASLQISAYQDMIIIYIFVCFT